VANAEQELKYLKGANLNIEMFLPEAHKPLFVGDPAYAAAYDWWPVIRNAVAALKITGGKLTFPRGRYRVAYDAGDAERTGTTGVIDLGPWLNGEVWTATENIEIEFANGAVLFMDNLMPNGYDAQTHAVYARCRWTDEDGEPTPDEWSGHAVNYGAIKLVNVTVEWTAGSQRGQGGAFNFIGTKSAATAPYDIVLENCQAYNAPQVGAIFCGCKHARTIDFYSENCWADTVHFNANFDNCAATNTKAQGSKDDTVALVTYYPDAITLALGLDTEVGPFTSPDRVTANNNGCIVDGVRKIGGNANGVRLLGANRAIVNNVYCDNGATGTISAGVWVGSVEANGTTLAESGLAPIGCQVTNVSVRGGAQVGVHIVSQGTDGSEGDDFLDVDVLVNGIRATDCVQASIWGDRCGGFRIKGAKVDTVKCDFTAAWDYSLDIESAGDVYVTGTATSYAELDMNDLPVRNVHLDRIKIDGGRLVLTDVNKITAKQIEVHNSSASAIEGIRVLNFMCPDIRVVNPNRSGTVALANIPVRCIPGRDWDVAVEVLHDNTPVQNLIEIGGGDAYNISQDIRITSVLTHEVAGLSTDPYEIQSDAYAPVNVARRSRARKSGTWTNTNIDDMPLPTTVNDLFANGVNLGALYEADNVGAWIISRSAGAGGAYRVGFGYNCKFDGSNWVTVGDGTSNGGAVTIAEYGGTHPKITHYTIPSTGGTAQTISNASLASYLRQTISDEIVEATVKYKAPDLQGTNLADAPLLKASSDGTIENAVSSGDFELVGVNLGGVRSGANPVGVWLVERSAESGGGYLVCLGLNIKFNGTNWVTGTDGGSNGAALVAMNYGDGNMQFYAFPSTGGTVQTIIPANLVNYRRGWIDTSGNLTLNGLTASQPVMADADKKLASVKVNLNSADHVNVASFTDGALIARSGTKFASAAAFAATRNLITNGDGNIVAQSALSASKPMQTDGSGLPGTCEWTDVANAIEAALLALGFIDDTAMATYTYSKAEVDTLLESYALASHNHDGSYASTTHSHTYGGTTGTTEGHSHGYSGETS